MISIINSNCSFKKINDTYVIKNLAVGEYLNYTLLKYNCDAEDTEIETNSIFYNESKVFSNLVDGEYHVILNVDDTVTHGYFSTYTYLRKQFISILEKLLCCNCGCNGSDETLFISKDCKTAIEFQGEYGYILSYLYAIKPLNDISLQTTNPLLITYLENLFNIYKCNINKELCKQYFSNCLEGLNIYSDLNKLQLGLIYLSLYFYEKFLITPNDTSELLYLNTVYDYNNILKCIKKLGISIETLEDLLISINNNLLKPNHVSNIFYNTDYAVIAVMFKSLFLLNYKDSNNSPMTYIKFYNSNSLNAICKLGNNQTIVDGVEYPLSGFTVLGTPLTFMTSYTSLTDAGLNTNYPGRLLTIKTGSNPSQNEILQYGIRNSLSETYTNGTITINII